MQDSALSHIILIVALLGGIIFFVRNAKAGRGFGGTLILSGFATLVFALFFIGGLLILFNNTPPYEVFPGVQVGVIRAVGCGLALFGMFGLLIARGLAVLISIEHTAHTLATGPDGSQNEQEQSSAAYRFGQIIGKTIHGGELTPRGQKEDET